MVLMVTCQGLLTPRHFTLQPLDHAIVLRFANRQEDRFDPDVQTQPYKGAKDSWHFGGASEGRVVVYLQPIRYPQRLPGGQRVHPHRRADLVAAQGLRERLCLQICTVDNKDLGTTRQVARSNP